MDRSPRSHQETEGMIGSLVCETSEVTLPLNISGAALGKTFHPQHRSKGTGVPGPKRTRTRRSYSHCSQSEISLSIILAETYGRWRKVCQPYDLQAIRTALVVIGKQFCPSTPPDRLLSKFPMHERRPGLREHDHPSGHGSRTDRPGNGTNKADEANP